MINMLLHVYYTIWQYETCFYNSMYILHYTYYFANNVSIEFTHPNDPNKSVYEIIS